MKQRSKKDNRSFKNVPVMLAKAEAMEVTLKEEIESLKTSAVCSCCGQDLPKNQKEKHIKEKETKLLECQKALKIAKEKNQELYNAQDDFKAYNVTMDTISDDIMGIDYRIGNGEENVKRLKKEKARKTRSKQYYFIGTNIKRI
jgi:hypothetical protein